MPRFPHTEGIAIRTLSWVDEEKFTFLWDYDLVLVHAPGGHQTKGNRFIISTHAPEALEEILEFLSHDWIALPHNPFKPENMEE